MLSTFTYPQFAYRPAPEQGQSGLRQVPLVIVGAGPVGLCAAIDAAQQGLPVILLDEDKTVSLGSRGLCYAKRTLEILDRLGVGEAVCSKGVTWNVGRTFHRDAEVFNFNLLPDAGHRRPGMVNLQQYWLEQFLVERAQQLPTLELRWQHRVTALHPDDDKVTLDVHTPDGPYRLAAEWLVAADGARSPLRRHLGLDVEGKVFQDRFLIADVVLSAELFPADKTERWFWFDPPFHSGQSVLLHREADNVWRIDFQLGWDADPEAEKAPERVQPRIRALLDSQGFQHIGFELEWVSVYTFQCRRMKHFRHGRVLFAGDAAHQVSPFGARGANSGIQDADNLIWKLKSVIDGNAPHHLLDSYGDERGAAADENIANSTRSTDFITPKSHASQVLRDAVLSLAHELPLARAWVNSGRLSVASCYPDSPLNTPVAEVVQGWMLPGSPMDDAPVRWQGRNDWLLSHLGGGFVLMVFVDAALSEAQRSALAGLAAAAASPTPASAPNPAAVRALLIHPAGSAALPGFDCLEDADGLVRQRCGGSDGTTFLLRPDQHVAARWPLLDAAAVRHALLRALARPQPEPATANRPS